MAEEADTEASRGNFASSAILSAASREKADSFVDKQNELADLQIEDLKRENAIRHWSLRIRHVSDVLKLGFELAVAFIVIALAVGLGAVIWQATQADGLVIEAFNVPDTMAQHGLSGPVIASKLLDRLTTMQNQTDSSRAPSSFANDWTNQIAVQIPDTGISLGEVVRFLDDWLGRQMHLSGDVYENTGSISLTVRIENDPGQTFTGKPSDLDAILAKAAEAVYARAQPYRYSVFLADHNRPAASEQVLRELRTSSSPVEQKWADLGLAILLQHKGDFAGARGMLGDAAKIDPAFPNIYALDGLMDSWASHDEATYQDAIEERDALNGDGANDIDSRDLDPTRRATRSSIAQAQGDFTTALADNVLTAGSGGTESQLASSSFIDVSLHDIAATRQNNAALNAMRSGVSAVSIDADNAQAGFDLERKDWRAAIADLDATAKAARTISETSRGALGFTVLLEGQVLPQKAYAEAMLGDFASAQTIFATLPKDCDLCMRMRGRAEAARRNWTAAVHWFALVSARSPHIPFADTDWGQMLLQKGDLDGAIAKFESANQKGPHFADPLEMWGEALIRKNRSDLALAKFAEADKYAPKWGRLHLKWGEALWWSGDHDDARKQFAIAATLDLTASEKSERTRVMHG